MLPGSAQMRSEPIFLMDAGTAIPTSSSGLVWSIFSANTGIDSAAIAIAIA